ncbi:MAG: garvicin Q family class II bacteriocin [Lactobacillus sp.]|nr:garvicin Q family class II bacteriocin [Lactobacillus sp.]
MQCEKVEQAKKELDDSNNVSPFVSFVKRSRHHKRHHKIDIVGFGSNGYCYRDRHVNFHYRVTKSIGQATWDTIVYGWGTTDAG